MITDSQSLCRMVSGGFGAVEDSDLTRSAQRGDSYGQKSSSSEQKVCFFAIQLATSFGSLYFCILQPSSDINAWTTMHCSKYLCTPYLYRTHQNSHCYSDPDCIEDPRLGSY